MFVQALAKSIYYHDLGCVEFFRKGAPLYGTLEPVGDGALITAPIPTDPRTLQKSVPAVFDKVMASRSKPDEYHAELTRQAVEESVEGKLVGPLDPKDAAFCGWLLSPRFSVAKTKEDGTVKVRPVDDCTSSGLNAATRPTVKLTVDGADKLLQVAREVDAAHRNHEVPEFVKADIKAACRRIPIRPDHRWAAAVCWAEAGGIKVAQHLAMPFGAISSVHAWDRVAKLLLAIGRKLLKLPLLVYVDDFHGADMPTSAKHGIHCFARIVRAMLGSDAVAPDKLESGNPLQVGCPDFHFCKHALRVCAWHADRYLD